MYVCVIVPNAHARKFIKRLYCACARVLSSAKRCGNAYKIIGGGSAGRLGKDTSLEDVNFLACSCVKSRKATMLHPCINASTSSGQ